MVIEDIFGVIHSILPNTVDSSGENEGISSGLNKIYKKMKTKKSDLNAVCKLNFSIKKNFRKMEPVVGLVHPLEISHLFMSQSQIS